MKLISVVTACYNEEENVAEVYNQVKAVMKEFPNYEYEHIFIDNASTDKTVSILKEIAVADQKVKIIVNNRNFGHIRSPMHALTEARGNAVISIVADLQDPPHMIKDFIREWENGYKIVAAIKTHTQESFIMRHVRRLYYRFITRISRVELIKDFTGFGLYDKVVMDSVRELDDPYPYFRGMICDMGYPIKCISYIQPGRRAGITKNNFYTLYDMAMLGITNNSSIPLRIATMLGFLLSGVSLFVSLLFILLKLIFWSKFSFGIAPILISLFFFSAVQLFFIGMIGEYMITIQTKITKRPLVYEKERINF